VSNSTNNAEDAAGLRGRAEARLQNQQKSTGAESGNQKSEADMLRLLHELEVHQIELEMQKEELQEARDKMDAALEEYTDLYDFAPVGYLTLDQAGNIRAANFTAVNRHRAVQRHVLGLERYNGKAASFEQAT